MCLVLEIIMILMGFWALIKGRLQISKNRVLEGRQAKITGIVLILPIPLALAFSLILSQMMTTRNGASIVADPSGFEYLFVIVAIIFAVTQKPANPDPD